MKPNLKKNLLIYQILFYILTLSMLIAAFMNPSIILPLFSGYVVLIAIVVLVLCCLLHKYNVSAPFRNRQNYANIVNKLDTPALMWNPELDYVIANRLLTDLLKLPANYDSSVMVPALFGLSRMTEQDARRIHGAARLEKYITTTDGREICMLWNTSDIIIAEDDNTYYLSVGFDITEMKQIEEKMKEASRKLSNAQERHDLSMNLAEIGMLLTTKEERTFYCSKELQDRLDLEQVKISFEDFRKIVHPADLTTYDTCIKRIEAANMDMPEYDTVHNLEMRLRTKSGSYNWYQYRYKRAKVTGVEKPVFGGCIFDITTEKEKDRQIELMAYQDEITGMYNRNRLMEMGKELYECGKILNISHYVIVLDIDRFHLVNDTCGYERGNQVLKLCGETICRYKAVGTDNGFVARISGDSFALIIRDYGDVEAPVRIVESIQQEFSTELKNQLSGMMLTVSAGYAKLNPYSSSFDDVLEQAEFALSSSERKPNTIISYDSTKHEKIVGHSELELELAEAIENRELKLFYQPKFSLHTGKMIGVESLIRWIKPDGTVIEPSQFMPVAEASDMITKISSLVLYEACWQGKQWIRMGMPPLIMAVNLTSEDFLRDDLVDEVKDVLAKTGFPPEYLEIELTESLALFDIDHAIAQMEELRKLGVRFAMDDFGTGYSSLSYLAKLPITLLKLDRSFIVNMNSDQIAAEIITAVIRIAKSKKIETIAEGIESEEQALFLKNLGCDHVQGYLYGKPMPPEKLCKYHELLNQKHEY